MFFNRSTLSNVTKKIWICGHSLGAAQAVLFARFLQKREGIVAQGVYAYACPLVGDATFAAETDSIFAHNPIQRYEFVDDPATMFPAPSWGYKQVGIRNYFVDIHHTKYHIAERKASQSNVSVLMTGVDISFKFMHDVVNSFTKPIYINLQLGKFCYHHPEWYLQALYSPSIQTQLLALKPMPIPTTDNEDCNCYSTSRAEESDRKAKIAKRREHRRSRRNANWRAIIS